jgi:hypothetical protein
LNQLNKIAEVLPVGTEESNERQDSYEHPYGQVAVEKDFVPDEQDFFDYEPEPLALYRTKELEYAAAPYASELPSESESYYRKY